MNAFTVPDCRAHMNDHERSNEDSADNEADRL